MSGKRTQEKGNEKAVIEVRERKGDKKERKTC